MKAVKIGLVQINASFSNQSYLPLSVASLWSYSSKHSHFKDILELTNIAFNRDDANSIYNSIIQNHILGASLYTWNEQASLKLLAEAKRKNPSLLVIAGGPQVPDEGTQYLLSHPYIDVLVHGEGEVTFKEVIDCFIRNNFRADQRELSNISGISYRIASGPFKGNYRNIDRARAINLDLPSPFLDGTFDDLLEKNPNQKWMALWETNRGCPFSCTFCDWGSATNSKVSQFSLERLKEEFSWIASRQIEFVFLCDANFGLLPRDIQIADFMSEISQNVGFPKRVSTQGAKNLVDRSFNVQKILYEAGIGNGAALSMQSLNSGVLKAIERENISLIKYAELQVKYREAGIPTYVDLILGLPEETLETFKSGISKLIEGGAHDHIQFNNLSLLPNAKMNQWNQRELFGFVTINAPVKAIHGQATSTIQDALEHQELVIATNAMPLADWREARVFAWAVSLFHLNKILQPQIILAKHLELGSYQSIIEEILGSTSMTISEIRQIFFDFAQKIQDQGEEYFANTEFLDIYWTADEYVFIKIVNEDKLIILIEEIEEHFASLIKSRLPQEDQDLALHALRDATLISSEWLILPNSRTNSTLQLYTNFYDVMNKLRNCKSAILQKSNETITIDRSNPELSDLNFSEWMRKVVWYRNKRGDYSWEVKSDVIGKPEGHLR